MSKQSDVEQCKVVFVLEKDEDDYPPANSESLWATKVEEGLMLDNIPFFAQDVNWGDIVEVDDVDGELIFRTVVKPSGHGTVRLLVRDKQNVQSVRAHLLTLGCASEASHLPRLISVDVPPTIDIDAFTAYVEEECTGGLFGYEEGSVWWL